MTTQPIRLLLCTSICIAAYTHANATVTHVQDVGSAGFASDAAGDAGTLTIPVNSVVQAGDIVVLEGLKNDKEFMMNI